MSTKKLEKLKSKIAHLNDQFREETKLQRERDKERNQKAREHQKSQKQKRSNLTHCKCAVGGLLLKHREIKPDSEFTQELNRLLDRHIDNPRTRKLLELEPLPETSKGIAANDFEVSVKKDAQK